MGNDVGKLGMNASRMQLPGQVVIPVDCVAPDMPVSMDEDSVHLHMGQKFTPGVNPAHYSYAQQMQPKSSGAMSNAQAAHAYANGHVPSEPVVDLSVPMNAQPDYMGAAFAPKQDIFDTWYALFLSGFALCLFVAMLLYTCTRSFMFLNRFSGCMLPASVRSRRQASATWSVGYGKCIPSNKNKSHLPLCTLA